MSKKELDQVADEFKKWNPMRDDYLDSRFNLYDSGPGAALDSALQPAELAKEGKELSSPSCSSEEKKKDKVYPYLMFKNLPKGMTERSLSNLCARYANVKEVNYVGKLQSVFVYFKNIADMESVHRALSQNEYGFKVLIGKHFLNQRKNRDTFELLPEKRGGGIIDPSPPSSGINIEKRVIIPPAKNPPRPTFSKNNAEGFNVGGTTISKDDPLRYSLQNDDDHGLERAGIEMPKLTMKNDDEYEIRTGRAFIRMPLKTRQFLEEANIKSKGNYEADKKIYRSKAIKGKENPHIVYKCIVCEEPADISCYRCCPKLYIYCGKKCQNVDWEEHRKICGRKVGLENDLKPQKPRLSASSRNMRDILKTPELKTHAQTEQEIVQEINSPSSMSSNSSQNESFAGKSFPKPEMPSTSSLVVMTAVSKTNLVFVRSKSREANIKFFETIGKIQVAAKKLKPLKNLPGVGQAVIAKFHNSHEFGRALVLSVENTDKIKINFLDYGNIETQNLSNIYRIPKEFIDMPRFAVPVILKDVPNYYMSNEVRSFMYSYLRDIDLIVKYDEELDLVKITNVYQVDLYDKSTNQHLNRTIATLCKPVEPKTADDLLTVQDLEVQLLPVGKNLKFYVMDNSMLNIGCLSCTTKDFALEIEKFSDDIQRYAKSLKPQNYAPRQGELCIAKYSEDGLWYRGRCIEKVGDGQPTILFIDYGNIALVKVADIRPYPLKFSWPVYTADFGIEGLPIKVDDKVVERLEQLLPCGYAIQCDLVEKDPDADFYNATLNNVIKTLEDEGLIE